MSQFYLPGSGDPPNSLTADPADGQDRDMATARFWLPVLALLAAPAAVAGDYVGVLRPSAPAMGLAIPAPGFYWLSTGPMDYGLGARASEGFKLKLGYRYSRYLSVETGFADFGAAAVPQAPFLASPANNRGFSLDTVGTLPLWSRVSLYGRLGAWRAGGGTSLLAAGDGSPRGGAGLRYGLGLKVKLTQRLRLNAEMEHLSPLDRWGNRDADTDQLTVGVTWRF